MDWFEYTTYLRYQQTQWNYFEKNKVTEMMTGVNRYSIEGPYQSYNYSPYFTGYYYVSFSLLDIIDLVLSLLYLIVIGFTDSSLGLYTTPTGFTICLRNAFFWIRQISLMIGAFSVYVFIYKEL
ncbi:unnamed protein product, partial [Mesorhabditis belari]|uniref:Uncharacterized protein n=1 Tax=Mesorhabditis belari TaxID=2138241 RepID=A0AAF3E8K7_9BILA